MNHYLRAEVTALSSQLNTFSLAEVLGEVVAVNNNENDLIHVSSRSLVKPTIL